MKTCESAQKDPNFTFPTVMAKIISKKSIFISEIWEKSSCFFANVLHQGFAKFWNC